MVRQYKTPKDFRIALEQRLNKHAHEQHVDIMRLRRLVSFECFAARLFAQEDTPWVLKGGYVSELRHAGRARSTKDMDLTFPYNLAPLNTSMDQLQTLRELLQDAADRNRGDRFEFRISQMKEKLDAPPHGGGRFSVMARLDNREFATFQLDVTFADDLVSPPEWLTGQGWLDFAGIPAPQVAVLAAEQQFAEKIHAYTLPYSGTRLNSRVKDLADLVMFIEMGSLDMALVIQAVRITFERRGTHEIPATLLPPREDWRQEYAALAHECALQATTLETAFELVSAYWARLDMR